MQRVRLGTVHTVARFPQETICKAFGMTLGEFFAEGELVPLTKEQQVLLDKWALLTAEQKQLVLNMIDNMK